MKEAHLSKADFKTSENGFKRLFLTSDDWQRHLQKSTEAYCESIKVFHAISVQWNRTILHNTNGQRQFQHADFNNPTFGL